MKLCIIDPFNEERYLQNRFFDGPCGPLRDLLAEQGYEIKTPDMADLSAADMVLCFNYNEAFYQRCVKAGLSKDKLVLFTFEPKSVIPRQYDPEIWDRFGKIFTFLDDRVDGKRIFKLLYPQHQPLNEHVPSFNERSYLVLINSNKYSYVDGELYSLRRQVIRFFEKRTKDFGLYGYDWDKGTAIVPRAESMKHKGRLGYYRELWEARKPYSSLKGGAPDKNARLMEYKFAICFENTKDVQGYVTEKIFDCLIAGTIPIYLGASNITDYFPEECIIDMRKFKDLDELKHYLDGMTEEEFNKKQRAGQEYLHSERFEAWRPRPVLKTFVDGLMARSES